MAASTRIGTLMDGPSSSKMSEELCAACGGGVTNLGGPHHRCPSAFLRWLLSIASAVRTDTPSWSDACPRHEDEANDASFDEVEHAGSSFLRSVVCLNPFFSSCATLVAFPPSSPQPLCCDGCVGSSPPCVERVRVFLETCDFSSQNKPLCSPRGACPL